MGERLRSRHGRRRSSGRVVALLPVAARIGQLRPLWFIAREVERGHAGSSGRLAGLILEPVANAAQGLDVCPRVAQLLAQVGLSVDDGEKYPHEFSGGQRQRISIARALVHEPLLLIFDEATAALDGESEAAVWQTIASLRGHTTVVAISHNPAVASAADLVYRIAAGRAERVAPAGTLAREAVA